MTPGPVMGLQPGLAPGFAFARMIVVVFAGFPAILPAVQVALLMPQERLPNLAFQLIGYDDHPPLRNAARILDAPAVFADKGRRDGQNLVIEVRFTIELGRRGRRELHRYAPGPQF